MAAELGEVLRCCITLVVDVYPTNGGGYTDPCSTRLRSLVLIGPVDSGAGIFERRCGL